MQSLTSFDTNSLYEALNTLKATSGIFSKVEIGSDGIYCYDTNNEVVLVFYDVNTNIW
jgi:hypothetical protein